MSNETNPFAAIPSGAGFAAQGALALHQVDGMVETPTGGRWPARCVVCNAAVPAADFEATLTWHPGWVKLLFFVIGFLAIFAMMSTRELVRLDIGMCAEHRARRTRRLRAFTGTLVLGVLAWFGGAAIDADVLAVLGVFASLIGLVGVVVVRPPLRVQRVEGDIAWIRVGAPFLASLPEK
ncbi:MAG: hypothetical protein V4850_06345 [Myxococcota bacterium]